MATPQRVASRRLQRGGLALPLRLALRLELLHPAADELTLERAEVIDEQLALQVIHLVLHAHREQRVRRFPPVLLAVPSEELDHDAAEPGHFLVLVRDREAAFGIRELALADLDDRVDEPEEPFALLLGRLSLGSALLDVDRDDVLQDADL